MKSGTFDVILEKIRKESKDTKELGDKFEKIMLDFFKVDRHYNSQFGNDVWSWKKYSKDNNIHRPDDGIDIVARQKDGTLCGIQCKCYADDGSIDLKALGTFQTACKTYGMKRMILVYTGDHITEKAEYHLKKNNGAILTSETLRSTSVDWSDFPRLKAKKPHPLRKYQKDAFDDVVKGFQKNDRGQLIMACGTGKTLVSLRIAEKIAPKDGIVLYLVPSITLIQQSMREWSENRQLGQYYIGVCSDKSVSGEEGSIAELESPVSTNSEDLKVYIKNRPKDKMTVIFCTYNSIQVVADALGNKKIDLVLCDEAHRTIGGADQSFFTKVHEDSNILIKKRLYMTATPKIFTDKIRKAADAQEKKIYAMDDKTVYGHIFHELKFDVAVHKYHALSDYRVRIAFIDPKFMDTELQSSMTNEEGLLPLSAMNKMVALWHSLQHPDYDEKKITLLQRIIVFSNTIRSSKSFTGEPDSESKIKDSFSDIVEKIKEIKPTKHGVVTAHVDGKTRALERKKQLRWLAESNNDPNNCRLLSNARCLSEGVDVPALDGVVFMEPRKSMVDVVQSVGRVMRKHPEKEYGYVILPVAIPAGEDINRTLDDGKTWKVVWEVLNALRSHDPDLAAQINQLVLEKKITKDGKIGEKIRIASITDRPDDPNYQKFLGKFYSKMSSKLVEKVGDINYYDKYGQELGSTSHTIEERIKLRLKSPKTKNEIQKLHKGLKLMINNSVSENETIRIVSQHMVLSKVFNALFQGKFASHNPISDILDNVIKKIGLQEELDTLEGFYKTAENELKNITTRKARQNFIKKIYENFFKSVAKKETEQHGIVYTPVEVIDFIIHSIQHILNKEFNLGFNDRIVKVFDPFTGTGTFLIRLLESNLITDNLYDKYRHDLFANEMILLAYYVATINIETTYSSLPNRRYVPFENINYTDTLRHNARYKEDKRHRKEFIKFDEQFRVAHNRVQRQKESHIHIIMGNPPYSMGQSDYNDQNQNTSYKELDTRIDSTFIEKLKKINSDIQQIRSLYDSYVRSIRWASDRIGTSGIIAFITNASFIRSETAAGIRASFAEEFTDIWCFDLRGNQRTQGETSKREGGKIFGSGSRAPVAITILVKNPNKKKCTIHYKDIGDYHTQEQKLKTIKNSQSIQGIKNWKIIKPDKHYDWLDQRSNEFSKYMPIWKKQITSKKKHNIANMRKERDESQKKHNGIFELHSGGISTSRDVWAYNSSKDTLSKNMKQHIDYCNSQNLDKPVFNSKQAKWSSDLSKRLKRSTSIFRRNTIRIALYRPFFKQYLYFDDIYNERQSQIPKIFPENYSKNLVICIADKGKKDIFSTIVTDVTPDLHIIEQSQCFPLYVYENKDDKKENILNSTLTEYRKYYKDDTITKKKIFYYVYAMLHHSKYRKKFANNLSRELPHIPMAPNFYKFSKAGERLVDLHLNFENGQKHNLNKSNSKPKPNFGNLKKISFGKTEKNGRQVLDTTKLKINNIEVFDNIPKIIYMVNGRTPLEWIIDRYRLTADKDSGIVNNPCEGMTESKTIDMIERMVHIGVKSDEIILDISKEEFELKDWKPKKMNLDQF